jgi:hypothetical protein
VDCIDGTTIYKINSPFATQGCFAYWREFDGIKIVFTGQGCVEHATSSVYLIQGSAPDKWLIKDLATGGRFQVESLNFWKGYWNPVQGTFGKYIAILSTEFEWTATPSPCS